MCANDSNHEIIPLQKYTYREISRIMHYMHLVFDVVRLVNTSKTKVVHFNPDGTLDTDSFSCYDIWKRSGRCQNCVSARACLDKERKTKFEFRDDDIYNVISKPFILIDDAQNEIVLALELVNQITDEMFLEAFGNTDVIERINTTNRKIYEDSLTGVYNRRYFDEHIYVHDTENCIPTQMGFVIVDIRKFKLINDTYGHDEGDNILRAVGQTIKYNIGKRDLVIRIGGDEFLIVFRECDEKEIEEKTENIKNKIEEIKMKKEPSLVISADFGHSYTSDFKQDLEFIHKLVREADYNMYINKKING